MLGQGSVYVTCFKVEHKSLAVSTNTVQPQRWSESGPEATPTSLLTIHGKYILQDKASDNLEGGSGVLGIHRELKSRLSHFSREGRREEEQIRYARSVTEVTLNPGCCCQSVHCEEGSESRAAADAAAFSEQAHKQGRPPPSKAGYCRVLTCRML